MFERFTGGARQVLALAQEEARLLGHGYVGTEHLLLGVAGVGDGVGGAVLRRLGFDAEAARAEARRFWYDGEAGLEPGDADALRSIGIDLDEVRRQAEEAFGPGALERARWRRRCRTPARAGLAFTPRTKRSLELALREALSLKHNHIGTEHVLLGLVREGEGLAAKLLSRQGVDLPRARAAVVEELRGYGEGLDPTRRGA